MSEQRPHNENDRLPEQLSVSELLRCAADDELTPAQQRELEQRLSSHPDDRGRIETDMSLRQAVSRVMAGEPAPDSVRAGVLALFAEQAGVDTPATVGGPATTQRSFWAGARRWSAVAAVLLVMVSVFLIASQRGRLGDAPVDIFGDAFRSSIIAHVEREHDRCLATDDYLSRKLSINETDEAQAFLTKYLGVDFSWLCLDHVQYELVGVGRCKIPGGDQAVQAIYRRVGEEGSYFSLFIQKDRETPLIQIDDDRCYQVPRNDQSQPPIYCWRSNDLIYYVVSCDPDVAGSIRRALGCSGGEAE
ncbi:MAG: hypothetical protein EA376_04470 [Phycisphaeraceae bacterium]|nr:MAG: hypothetical protein EA376_04470 [Phycisphaeraceae bacterium]